jgi:acylphosphatase
VKAVRLVVRGRVQGVFYRDWTVQIAGELGVSGWVRNCADGTVEALVQGDEAAVEAMIAHMKSGPPAARVDRIDRNDGEAEDLSRFVRR